MIFFGASASTPSAHGVPICPTSVYGHAVRRGRRSLHAPNSSARPGPYHERLLNWSEQIPECQSDYSETRQVLGQHGARTRQVPRSIEVPRLVMNAENAARGQTQIELICGIDVERLADRSSVTKKLIRVTNEAPVLRVRCQRASAVGERFDVLAMYSQLDVIELVFGLRLL